MTPGERRAYRLGRRSFDRGEDDDAFNQLSSLLHTHPGFADVHYMVGVLHDRMNDATAAARSLNRALRINPSYTEAILALASVYERQGDFDRSREIAERSRTVSSSAPGAMDPTTRGKLANLHAVLGDAYREAGELREAIEAYRKALDRCPDFHDIRLRLGVALREAGLPDQALADFRRILRGNPSFLDAAVQLGLTLYSLGRGADALAAWEEVLEKSPGREDALMYLRLVRSRKEPSA